MERPKAVDNRRKKMRKLEIKTNDTVKQNGKMRRRQGRGKEESHQP